jgi:hypothetical protein
MNAEYILKPYPIKSPGHIFLLGFLGKMFCAFLMFSMLAV